MEFHRPFLAGQWRVAALSTSGNGQSGWRPSYSRDQVERELFATAEAAGLFDAGAPVFIGHSSGGRACLEAGYNKGDQLTGVVMIDTPVFDVARESVIPRRVAGHRVYPTIAQALARFRFAPPQPCEMPFLVDFVARKALIEVEGGWTWRFDPALARDLTTSAMLPKLLGVKCPVAMIYGELSSVISPDILSFMREVKSAATPLIAIPRAHHHVLIDQPLALVAALRRLLESWPETRESLGPAGSIHPVEGGFRAG